MFFSKLPNIEYSISRTNFQFTDQHFVVAKNIFKRLTFNRGYLAEPAFAEYTLLPSETPDQVAQAFYGDPFLEWTILVTNNVIDINKDWYMDDAKFEGYMTRTYPDAYATKHWITKEIKNSLGEVVQPAGIIVYYDPDNEDSYTKKYINTYNPRTEVIAKGLLAVEPISHFQFESERNAAKQKIQLLNPELVQDFVKLFEVSTGYRSNQLLSKNTLKKTLRTGNIFTNVSL